MPDENRPVCLVLGGSFNPPTLAHRALARTCADRIRKATRRDAKCVLVPSSHNYVSRKMSKTRPGQDVAFPEDMRMDMCWGLINETPGADLSPCELGDDGKGHTYETLVKIQAENPDRQVMLIVGDDKLDIIPRWRNAERLLSEFGLAVTARGRAKDVVTAAIQKDPLLSRYAGNIYILDRLDGREFQYSSTEARRYYEAGDYDALAACCGFHAAMAMWRYRKTGAYDKDGFMKWRNCE